LRNGKINCELDLMDRIYLIGAGDFASGHDVDIPDTEKTKPPGR
jgi:hypothetical protein